MSNFPEMEYKTSEANEHVELVPDGTSLTLLQQVYRNSKLPLPTRMRAAGMALPHEHPKLGISMNVGMSEEFGAQLEKAIARANAAYDPRVIEHHEPKVIDQKPLGTVPDRRFRRV
jgi:hypothetical protein